MVQPTKMVDFATRRSTASNSNRPICWWIAIYGSFVVIVLLVLFNLFYLTSDKVVHQQRTESGAVTPNSCKWAAGRSQPVIYNLKTALGVSYKGSHWFHMAENFMVQHSILRASGKLTDSDEVYYNFDKGVKYDYNLNVYSLYLPF